MSDRIEWVSTAERVAYTEEPGEWVDGYGQSNDGPALAVGGVVIEGKCAGDLIEWLENAVITIRKAGVAR